MKRILTLSFFLWFLVIPVASFCLAEGIEGGEKKELPSDNKDNPLIKIVDREYLGVALGVRSTYFQLTQSRTPIVGHLVALIEEQNYLPYKPMIQINFSKYLALEFGYDRFKAMALNDNYEKDWSDGNLEWGTYMLGAQFRWPHFHPSIVPYVLGGFTYNKVSFNENNWWHYGFPSLAGYNEWVGQGNRLEDYTDYRRILEADDCYGALLGLGVDYFLNKHWAVNLDLRYHWARSNLTFKLADDRGVFSEEHRTWNMNSWIIGLGIKYFF